MLVDGFAPDRDPIAQARAEAGSLQRILEQHAGRRVVVRPVVLFPGWWVERQPKGVEVWVLNPKALASFVEQEPRQFNEQEVRILAEGLARYVRDQMNS